MKGSTQTGNIDEIVKTKYGGAPRFGFIFIGEGEARPRIYFNLTDFSDDKFRPRRGYQVTFVVEKDEQDRFYAKDVTLTADGKTTAAEREASIEKRGASGGEGGDKPKKERKKRPIDTREAKLSFTASGIYDGSIDVVAKVRESLGKLKHTCITAVGTEDITLNVFDSAGTLLTKEILREMKDGDGITLKKLEE